MNTITNQKTTNNGLEQFCQELLKRPELEAQLKTASDPESLCQMAVELGAEMGYEFTIEQVRAVMAIKTSVGGDFIEETDLTTGGASTFGRNNQIASKPLR